MAKFLGFNITRSQGPKLIEGDSSDKKGIQSFSTPFGKIGGGDLSKPYISTNYLGAGGYVRFGVDNLFPQLINQLYYTSPLNSSIINLKVNATIGGGFEIINGNTTAEGKVDEYTFLKKNKVNKLLKGITKNFVMHSAVYVCVHFNDKRKPIKFDLIPSEKVRADIEKEYYFISNDWSRGVHSEIIKAYSPTCKERKQIICLKDDSPGQDVYPLPSYITSFNWAFLDGEMSYFHKSNIQNSIFPSFALMLPKIPGSKEEQDQLIDTVDKAKGASNAGKALIFAANSKDELPDIKEVPTNQNDKLFLQTDAQIDLKISQAHQIDPILAGIRTSGKLGSGTDIKQSYTIFEKNVIKPLRNDIEEFMNEILELFNISGEFKIKDFQIIGDEIIETTK